MTTHAIMGGKVHVYRRGRSRYWQCSAYLAGRNRRVSTKEESLSNAKEFAEDWYIELRGKKKSGDLKSEKTFKQAAEQFLTEYEVITEGQRNAIYAEGHERRLKLHLLPFFGSKGLSEVTPGLVQEYRIERLNPDRRLNEKTFKEAAKRYLRECGFQNKRRTEREINVRRAWLKRRLIPYFGDYRIEEITPKVTANYRKTRRGSNGSKRKKNQIQKEIGSLGEMLRWIKWYKKPPSQSTLHHEIVTLRQVMKTAIRHRWLEHLPDFSPPFKASTKVAHRAWFSHEEYKTLYEATRARVRANNGTGRQWASEQLHDYVLFMANTGLRPDEANRLEFRDVEIVEDEATDETILLISVRGKRGVGYCKSMSNAVRPFERLRDRLRPVFYVKDGDEGENVKTSPKPKYRSTEPTDLIFPASHKKQFNTILQENNLKFDREGSRRTAYSLRHTYICFRLLEGADIYQIAKNCRTSVEMIEKYYASHISTTLDAAAINVRRQKVKKKQSDSEE